jgi:hypothetical protein
MELGWTLAKRRDHLEEVSKSGVIGQFRLEFQDKVQAIPVIRIPLGLPKYRLLNGRTASLQEEWLAEHPEKGEDFFRSDPELNEAQKAQHELLQKLIHGAGLLGYFKNPRNKQKECVILDSNGFVINGNRRLCAWRVLRMQDQETYAHFGHIDAALLPPCDDRAIDKLEGLLQVEPEIRDEYTWHSLANMMRVRKELHKLDDKALADFYKMSDRQIRELQEMLDYASVYLKSRGKPRHWSLVSDKEYAFRKMIDKRKSFPDAGAKKLFEECAFALIDDPTGRRLYESIPDLQKYFVNIRNKLKEQFPVPPAAEYPQSTQDDLLGPLVASTQNDIRLAEIIGGETNRGQAAVLIKEAIDSERQLKLEEDSANYVLKRLQQANSEVQSAISGIRAESKKEGVAEQVVAIESGLKELEKWAKA